MGASVMRLRGQVVSATVYSMRPARDGRRNFRSQPTGWRTYHRLDDCAQANLYHQPEKMLMFAILVDAISCFRKLSCAEGMHRKIKFIEAKNWLWSNRLDWPFSYRNVCEVLALDPDYLRRGLQCWIKTPRHHNCLVEKDFISLKKAYHSEH